MLVRFAGCCEPLPGDDIIGFVTRGRGVTVHTRGCVKVFALDPETGEERWRFDPEVDMDNEQVTNCRGVSSSIESSLARGAQCRLR